MSSLFRQVAFMYVYTIYISMYIHVYLHTYMHTCLVCFARLHLYIYI